MSSPSTSHTSLLKLLSLVQPHIWLFTVALIALGLGSAVNLYIPELIRQVLNSDAPRVVLSDPSVIALQLVALFGFQGVCIFTRIWGFGVVGQRVVAELREKLFNAILHRSLEQYDTERTGDLISRITSDSQAVQDAVSIRVSVIIRYTVQVLGGSVLMILISPRLTVAILCGLVLLVVLSMMLGKRLRFYSRLQQQELGAAATVAEEAFSGMRVIKAFGQEGFVNTLFGSANERALNAGLTRTSVSAFLQSFVSFLMNGFLVLVLLYGISLAARDMLSLGDLTSFFLYGVIVAVSFTFAIGAYTEMLQSMGALERCYSLIDSSGEAQGGRTLPVNGGGIQCEFHNVYFSYPARPDVPVLRGLTMTIPRGSVTALVGSSGAGKSTVAQLLMKFYEPQSGSIFLEGVSTGELSARSIRGQIAYVPQDAGIFGLTIHQNLLLGKSTASEQEMEEALRSVHLWSLIETLPLGLHTPVGDLGVQLSGGQRQRLSVARALLKNPSLVILDEATSALDSENEARVQEALELLMRGRTSLVIAHRLSTIRAANHVLVIEQGTLIQSGPYEELLNTPGTFQTLAALQELRANS